MEAGYLQTLERYNMGEGFGSDFHCPVGYHLAGFKLPHGELGVLVSGGVNQRDRPEAIKIS